MRNPDPLKINYLVIHDDDRADAMSPFQGFGRSWPSTLWALRLLALAPASVAERGWPLDGLIAQRMGGANRLTWLPLWIGALEHMALDEIGFALVVFTGGDGVAARVDAWSAAQPRPILHVRNGTVNDDAEGKRWCDTALREYCSSLFEAHGDAISAPRLAAARIGLERWMTRERRHVAAAEFGHNITLPNEMVLARAERILEAGDPFIGNTEDEYDAVVAASVQSVLDLREENGLRDFNRIYLPQPGLILTEPAFYRPSYARVRGNDQSTRPMLDALRRLQRQKGLCTTIEASAFEAFMGDERARALVGTRQDELAAQSHGVGLMAAQTCSAVMRLRPAVNHVFPSLSRFARNIRAVSAAARFKTPKLFDEIQDALAEAVGDVRLEIIERYRGSIKIVSDAPLELLPIAGLPLAMRHDTSRINATPGNLMMGELVARQSISLSPTELSKVLIVSGFADDDRLRNLLERSLDTLAPDLAGRVEVAFVRATTRAALVAALNASDATILVFDGHGTADNGEGVGGIVVGTNSINVWELRGEARIPPIVILSACDTQGMDAPNHATVGNGFLAAGATTVLATLLPIDGIEGAVFVSRLLYRLGHFLPAFLNARHRVVGWDEVVSGMLRMTLASETIDAILKNLEASRAVKNRANMDINTGDADWYVHMLENIAAAGAYDLVSVRRRARAAMARSEAIRYVQLGSPEAITISDERIEHQFFPPGLREALGIT